MSSTSNALSSPLGWFSQFLTSSIGRKLVMSLTGLFLVTFLLVHLAGNFQLLHGDGGEAFNKYSKFMTTNPLIKTVSYLLYFSILLHAIQGLLIWRKNRVARGGDAYKVKVTRATETNAFAAKNMGWLGTIILLFLILHMYQFWLQMKMGNVPYVTYGGADEYKDLYSLVVTAYENPIYVIVYVVSMIAIGYHLLHGFQSAFQTLGLNFPKYKGLIKTAGLLLSIGIAAGFAIIPVIMYGQSMGWW